MQDSGSMRVFLWTIVVCGLVLLCAELYGQLFANPSPYALDNQLGWRLKKNIHHTYTHQDTSGGSYTAKFGTDSDGFRTFGEKSKEATNILVIGDSFTTDPFAGDSEMWYAVMATELSRQLKKEVFVAATGGSGYGTFQQLILADEVSHLIRPDIFILQFCSNDFVNNHMEWESSGIVRNQYMRRPYYIKGSSVPKFNPHPFAWFYRSSIFGYSRVLGRLDTAIQGIEYKIYEGYGASLPTKVLALYEQESIEITKELLSLIRKVFVGIPSFITNCNSTTEGPNKLWVELGKEAGFIPISAPSDAVLSESQLGKVVSVDGWHWNPLGNAVYGRELANRLATTICDKPQAVPFESSMRVHN